MTTTSIGEVETRQADVPESPKRIPAPEGVLQATFTRHPRLEWLVLLALAALMLAQLWTSVVQLSVTSDEVDHLHAAYRYWQCNDFGWNPEHPPLVKMVAGLPLQFMHVNDPFPQACGALNTKVMEFLAGHQFVFSNPESVLTRARRTVSLFPILLLLTTWLAAKRMFGPPVAVIASVLLAFEPNILAHGALVTTDVAATLGFILAVYAAYCYVIEPSSARILALGLAVGFALCLKFSTILLALILPALMFGDAMQSGRIGSGRRLLQNLGALFAAVVMAFILLWACYGFRYAARPGAAQTWSPPRLSVAHGTVATVFIPLMQHWRVLPQAYLLGLQDVLVESEVGRPSFLLGEFYRNGNWFYFPVDIAIKFTVPLLLTTILSALCFRFWRSKRRELLFLLLPPAIFFVFSMQSKLNMGVRHVLPLLPFLYIFAAAGAWKIGSGRMSTAIALVAIMAFQVGSSLHAYPNYISYSNEFWGGPSETYRYLANSDVDWGQAQKMALDYIEKTRPRNCFFLRTYNNKNSDYGIPCGGISEIQWDPLQTPYEGTMIVSSSMINGVGVKGVSVPARKVFHGLKPIAKIGGSALLVFQGTFDVSPIVAVQLLFKARREGEENPQLALELAQEAAKFDPLNGDAHAVMCGSYYALDKREQAEQECNIGLLLIRKDPQYSPEQVRYMEDFVSKKGLKIHSNASVPQQ